MCDQVQGFLLGRPMQIEGSTKLMAARARMPVSGRLKAERPELGDDQACNNIMEDVNSFS
jgi:hypothetical protein